MTAAELMDALRAAHAVPGEGEGTTVQEMADAAGCGLDHVRRQLRPLVRAGKVRVSRKPCQGIDGVWRSVASYVLIEEAAPVKRGRKAA